MRLLNEVSLGLRALVPKLQCMRENLVMLLPADGPGMLELYRNAAIDFVSEAHRMEGEVRRSWAEFNSIQKELANIWEVVRERQDVQMLGIQQMMESSESIVMMTSNVADDVVDIDNHLVREMCGNHISWLFANIGYEVRIIGEEIHGDIQRLVSNL